MSAVTVDAREERAAPDAATAPRERWRLQVAGPLSTVTALLDARRVLEAQTGGTLVLRANDVVCRALKETRTIAAFALWNGPGM